MIIDFWVLLSVDTRPIGRLWREAEERERAVQGRRPWCTFHKTIIYAYLIL